MALTERNGIWHWRKIVQGHAFARSTKSGDKKLAEQIAALWEADAINEVVLKGTKPVLLNLVIKAFLDARKGTGGHANAHVHLRHFLALPNVRMGDLTLAQVQGVIQKRRDAGAAHNTLAVTVSYYNAVVKFSEAQKWATGVRLPLMYPEKTRLRYLSHEEEAALFAPIDSKAKYPGSVLERTRRAKTTPTGYPVCSYRCPLPRDRSHDVGASRSGWAQDTYPSTERRRRQYARHERSAPFNAAKSESRGNRTGSSRRSGATTIAMLGCARHLTASVQLKMRAGSRWHPGKSDTAIVRIRCRLRANH